MLMKDANILRERYKRRLQEIPNPDGIVAQCVRSFIEAIDDLPEIEVKSADEYESLLRRFRHLIQSDYIRSFDELGSDGKYKRDIAEAGLFRPQIFSVGLVCSDDPNCSPFDGNAMTQAEYFGLNGGGGKP